MFQKRLDGSADLYRGLNDYKLGFGNLNVLDKINRLTNIGQASCESMLSMTCLL